MTLLAPIDILLPLLWLLVVVVSAQRGLVGLIAGLAGAVFIKPLLLLASYSAPLALVVALLLGFLVTLLVRPFPNLSYRQPRWGYLAGATRRRGFRNGADSNAARLAAYGP